MKQLCCALVVSALMGNAAITAQTQSRETRPHVRVTVSFTQGPESHWELTEAEIEVLIEMLATLKSRAAETEHDHLGFRGFDVILRDSVLLTSEEIRVYDGIVRRGEGKRSRWFEDKERRVERWLLATGKQRVGPGVYEGVKIQVESSRRQ